MLADFYVNHRNTFTEKLSHDNLEGSLKSSVMAFRGLPITFWLEVAEALDPPEQIALFDQAWFWKSKFLAALVGRARNLLACMESLSDQLVLFPNLPRQVVFESNLGAQGQASKYVARHFVKHNGMDLAYFDDHVRSDTRVLVLAVSQCWLALDFAPLWAKSNPLVVHAATTQNAEALGCAILKPIKNGCHGIDVEWTLGGKAFDQPHLNLLFCRLLRQMWCPRRDDLGQTITAMISCLFEKLKQFDKAYVKLLFDVCSLATGIGIHCSPDQHKALRRAWCKTYFS